MGYFDKVTYRVVNSLGKTTGFIVKQDGREVYLSYYTVVNNIEYINNLTVDSNGVVRSKAGNLKCLSTSSVYKKLYDDLCKDNPLDRDIQHRLLEWKTDHTDDILLLLGVKYAGKRTELLKFAYSHYEQVIHLDLENDSVIKDFVNLVTNQGAVCGIQEYCRKHQLEEFNDSDKTIVILTDIQESPEIYNSIQSIKSQLHCDVALTVSYLGISNVNDCEVSPKDFYEIELNTLCFDEFIKATKKVKGIDASKLKEDYCNIGGYPEVVMEYLKTGNLDDCQVILKQLFNRIQATATYQFASFKHYELVNIVLYTVFIDNAKTDIEVKHTMYSLVNQILLRIPTYQGVSKQDVVSIISWLVKVKILNVGIRLNSLGVQFYFNDCGIESYIAHNTGIDRDIISNVLSENFALISNR